jgi:hypothetical protein
MVSITIKCRAPKRLCGDYHLNSFEDLYLWILRKFKDPSYANNVIIRVAKRGGWDRQIKQGLDIEIISSSKLGYEAEEMARKIGCNGKAEKGLEFAKSVDKILN